jgi:hypothetical protein
MVFGSKKKGSSQCAFTYWVVVALYLFAAVLSGVGVYKAHFLSSGMTFGTTSGSLAIVAFVLSLTFLKKSLCCCCSSSGKK